MSILIVDDSYHIRIQLKIFLNSGGHADLFFAENALEAFEFLGINTEEGENKPTIEVSEIKMILMDIFMPEIDGIEACWRIKEDKRFNEIPIIMVTADTSSDMLLAAFEAGAVDYINKPLKKIELLSRVNSALKLKNEIDARKEREKELLELTWLLENTNKELKKANESLHRMASIDGLTGIANRRHFEEFFEREWKRAVRSEIPMSLLMIDIDFFKAYNDTYGHQSGDVCLRQVAASLSETLRRPLDLAARYGGEEFVILLNETDSKGAVKVAEMMCKTVSNLNIPHQGSKISNYVTVSIGVATIIPSDKFMPDRLITCADTMLYEAKASGRKQFKVIEDCAGKFTTFCKYEPEFSRRWKKGYALPKVK